MIRRTIPTIIFYFVVVLSIFLGDKYSPGGPCTPGAGALVFLVAVPLGIFLFFRNIWLTTRVGRANLPSTGIHFLVLAGFFLYLFPGFLR
jgi:hypothetical protein